MKLRTIKQALSIAIASPDVTPSDRQSLIEAYDEVQTTFHRLNTPYAILQNDSPLDIHCNLISWFDLSNLLNESTYNTFGRIVRETIDNHPDSEYQKAYAIEAYCKEMTSIGSGYESLTVEQVIDVGDFLWDLWHDNEDCGVHDSTGAFKNIEQAIIKKLTLADKARVDRDLGEMHWDGYIDRVTSLAGLDDTESAWLKYLIKEDKTNG